MMGGPSKLSVSRWERWLLGSHFVKVKKVSTQISRFSPSADPACWTPSVEPVRSTASEASRGSVFAAQNSEAMPRTVGQTQKFQSGEPKSE